MTESNSTPDIWLNEYEGEGEMPCGCRLVSSVDHEDDPGNEMGGEGAAFYQCHTHAAAPEMAALLRELVAGWDDRSADVADGSLNEADFEKIIHDLAWEIVSRARPILASIDGGQP